jgi:predicted nucleic acid-binding protein
VTVVVDTGPLVAAINKRDEAHALSVALVTQLGRDLVIPDPVLVEVDYLMRARVSMTAARSFMKAIAAGEHRVAFLSQGLLQRAVEIDSSFADIGLGFVDATVMAYAERHNLPILTFDFEHFRATSPEHDHWKLVIDEHRYQDATR